MEEIVSVHVIIKGTVQGVGFRAFVEFQAHKSGVKGWVRNCPDGTVEVEAEGPRPVLDAFLLVLKQGPQYSHVTEIVVDWKDLNRQTQGFTIRRG